MEKKKNSKQQKKLLMTRVNKRNHIYIPNTVPGNIVASGIHPLHDSILLLLSDAIGAQDCNNRAAQHGDSAIVPFHRHC